MVLVFEFIPGQALLIEVIKAIFLAFSTIVDFSYYEG